MAILDKVGTARNLVDTRTGQISREIFVSDELYEMEQEQVFARAWLFVGHESQVPNPGDYFVSSMGEESVILVRDRNQNLHVFLNTCRHRGMKVCRYDEGNTAVFTCPYHGWSFGTDGALAGIPHFQEAYDGELDRSAWGLIEVAQMTNYKGAIWATWDPKAVPFLDYLGDMKLHLDNLLDCRDGREGGSEVLGGIQKWTMPCNWKFPSENFAGDSYHNISHRSVDLTGIGPSGKGRRDDDRRGTSERLLVAFPGTGHAATSVFQAEDTPNTTYFGDNPIVNEYFEYCHEERRKRLGEKSRVLGIVGNVFPHMSFLARQPRSIAVWHPRRALQTEAWRWFLVDRDAPKEVKEALRHYYMRYSGPGGMTEQDDMENWNYASAASKGVIARRYPYNYQQRLGKATTEGPIPGLTDSHISEQNVRCFYDRWADFMDAPSWDELL